MSRDDQGGAGSGPANGVDPRAPRFGQTITASLFLIGLALQEPIFVLAVALILDVALITGWRVHVYSLLWRHGVSRLVGPPGRLESPSPHRFASLLGAAGTSGAIGLFVLGFPIAAWAIAAAVAGAAGLAAVTGYCLGCQMYQSVSTLRRLDVV